MIVVWGTRLFGKCDQVPGECYTATRFFYIQFLPLVPLKSFLIVHGSEAGIEIPLSLKSIFFGWLRAGLVVGGLIGMVVAADGNVNVFLPPAMCAIAFGISYLLSRAGEERADECREALGLSRAGARAPMIRR
jgi:hypothetical protein